MSFRSPTAPERLLEAARTEFARYGLAGARTARIARRAGVNKQLIHYYFGTKEECYRAAVEGAGREVAAALSAVPLTGLTPLERVRRLVATQFDYLSDHLPLARLLLGAGTEAAWLETACGPLAALLSEGQATGFFRDDVDPGQLARQALILHLGYFTLHPLPPSWGGTERWRDQAAELIVRGCSW